MLTKHDAIFADEFHYGTCTKVVGPRGGVTINIKRVRRNGRTQTWVTRPNEWRIPVKYGLKGTFSIHDHDAELYHTAEDCPLAHS